MSSGRDRMAENDKKHGDVKNFWGDPTKALAYANKPLRFGEAKAMYRRDCRYCGAPLGFGRTNDGKTIPLDLRSPVYCVTGEGSPGCDSGVVMTHLCFVSHWATCPEWRKAKEEHARLNEGKAPADSAAE